MIGRDDTREVNAVEPQRLLLGFLDPQDAKERLVRSYRVRNPTADTDDSSIGEEFRERYRTSQAAIESLDVELWNPDIEPLPDTPSITEHVTEFVDGPLFRDVTGSSDEWRIGRFPISHLVAMQKAITTTRYEEMPQWSDDPVGVIEATLPVDTEPTLMPTTIQTPDDDFIGLQFTSRDPNVQVKSVETAEAEDQPGTFVKFHVKPTPNFVQIARYRGCYVLRNGYHRTYELLESGHTHVPAVIRPANTYEDVSGNDPEHFPERTVLQDRPPMFQDFLTNVAVETRTTGTNKLIRITAETSETPR